VSMEHVGVRIPAPGGRATGRFLVRPDAVREPEAAGLMRRRVPESDTRWASAVSEASSAGRSSGRGGSCPQVVSGGWGCPVGW
jgi:hypothetical protein